ncbi:unnamed protein product [Prunus armeniaca]
MASELKVEVIGEEKLRSSSPTPHHLQTTKLSVFDQIIPDAYVPQLFFYPSNNITDDVLNNKIDLHSLISERSKLLKKHLYLKPSLSSIP